MTCIMFFRFRVLAIPTCKYESCRVRKLGNREFSTNIQVFNSLKKINMLLKSIPLKNTWTYVLLQGPYINIYKSHGSHL